MSFYGIKRLVASKLVLNSPCIILSADDFPQCKRNDPNLENCILQAVEVVKPRLLTGVPEVSVPALDPFSVPTLKLDRTANNLRLKATIKNMKAYGGSNFKIEKLRYFDLIIVVVIYDHIIRRHYIS